MERKEAVEKEEHTRNTSGETKRLRGDIAGNMAPERRHLQNLELQDL